MAGTPISTVREAVAGRIAKIAGLRVHEIIGGPYNPPCAVLTIPEIDYQQAFQGGTIKYDLDAICLVSRTNDKAAQQTLDELSSPDGAGSVLYQFRSDPTLGGKVQNAVVVRYRALNAEEVEGYEAFGGVFTLEIRAAGR